MKSFPTTFMVVLCCGAALPFGVSADTALGFDVLGGVGTHGYNMKGSLDIKHDPARLPWETSLAVSSLHTTVGTESRANQISLGLSHEADDTLEGHGNLVFWKDTFNDIQ